MKIFAYRQILKEKWLRKFLQLHMCKERTEVLLFQFPVGNFTVVYLVTEPLSEAEGDLVVIETSILFVWLKKKFTFEKQQHLYYNKVTVSLTPVERLGNQATNCPIDYSFSENHVIGLFAVVCCWIQNYLCVLVMYPFTSYNYRIRQHSVWKLLANFILKIG